MCLTTQQSCDNKQGIVPSHKRVLEHFIKHHINDSAKTKFIWMLSEKQSNKPTTTTTTKIEHFLGN